MATRYNRTSFSQSHRQATQTQRYYTIGDLAREFGVTLRSLRFYEDRGLLNPIREGLVRLYDGQDRTRLQIILKGKQLGFTLSEIRDMVGEVSDSNSGTLALRMTPDQVRAQIEHLERQRSEIDLALNELRSQDGAVSLMA